MSKVSCLKIHDREEILSSFVTKEKIICNRQPKKKKPYPSGHVKRQMKYQCWHVDKHTRPWGSLFIFPWGIYKAAAFLIPVSCVSLVCMNYYTFIYDLPYCTKLSRQFWSSKRQRARVSDFSSNLKTTGSVTVYS